MPKPTPKNFGSALYTSAMLRNFALKKKVRDSYNRLKFSMVQVQKKPQPKSNLNEGASVVNMLITVPSLELTLPNTPPIMATNRQLPIFANILTSKSLNPRFEAYVIDYYTTRGLIPFR